MRRMSLILALVMSLSVTKSLSQRNDSIAPIENIPQRYYSKVDKKISSLNEQLSKKSLKYLAKFQRQEIKLEQTLQRFHPQAIIGNTGSKYSELFNKIKSKSYDKVKGVSGEYMPYIDSLGLSLSFLKKYNDIDNKTQDAFNDLESLKGNLKETENIKAFIADRKSQINAALSELPHLPSVLKKQFAQLNKTAYYYSAQIKEYKELLNQPDKLELKALNLLNQLPAYQKFVKENSALAGLFTLPGNYASNQALEGMQTRDEIGQMIRNRMGGGPNATQMFSQQLQGAQQGLQKFKDKLTKLGGGSGDIEIPDFVPQNQKTKPFLKRLEYGTNIQTTHASYNFPNTTDIGGSVGYKLKNKITLGIGASYKVGWGKSIQHIHVTSEGVGIRSFFECKLKKNFYATTGFEYDYQQPFNSVEELTGSEVWRQSGLLGISKEIDIKTKLLKKTKVQLLWNFLSYRQAVKTPALLFRMGYNF